MLSRLALQKKAVKAGALPAQWTRPASFAIHSSTKSLVELRRKDHQARTEYYGPGGYEARQSMSFQAYSEERKSELGDEPRVPMYRNGKTSTDASSGTMPLADLIKGLQEMSEEGRQPTKDAYLKLMTSAVWHARNRETASNSGFPYGELAEEKIASPFLQAHGTPSLGWKIALCAWEDARKGGIDLGMDGFELLMKAALPHPHISASLIQYALEDPTLMDNISGALEVWHQRFRDPTLKRGLETLLHLFFEMRRRNVTVPATRVAAIISFAAQTNQVRLALELALYEESQHDHTFETEVWAEILRGSADRCYIDGVEAAWPRVMESGTFLPDEGLSTLVLNAAGRYSRPDLALEVMAYLGREGIAPKSWHYPPLLEALCGADRIPDAMETVATMGEKGLATSLKAAEPIVKALSKSAESVDQGFSILQKLKSDGKAVDTTAFNAVIKAADSLEDANKVMAVFSQADALQVTPNIETYLTLLSACTKAGAIPQAEYLLDDMDKRKLEWRSAADTPLSPAMYTQLIELYLTAEENYEPAFGLLEDMKKEKVRVPLQAYEMLVKKCVAMGDSRSQPLLQEMQAGGYKPSKGLIEYVRNVAGGGDDSRGQEYQ